MGERIKVTTNTRFITAPMVKSLASYWWLSTRDWPCIMSVQDELLHSPSYWRQSQKSFWTLSYSVAKLANKCNLQKNSPIWMISLYCNPVRLVQFSIALGSRVSCISLSLALNPGLTGPRSNIVLFIEAINSANFLSFLVQFDLVDQVIYCFTISFQSWGSSPGSNFIQSQQITFLMWKLLSFLVQNSA